MAPILLDIDGVLQLSGAPIPGAPEALDRLRADGHRLRLVTNNTTRARSTLVGELRALGFSLEEEEVDTTPIAAARLLEGKRVLPLTMPAVQRDLAGLVDLVEAGAEAVLVGGADETDETNDVFSWRNLNRAYAELERGARLLCLHKNRWWQTSQGPLLDAGAFVAGLEYAAGIDAEVVGKPSRAYFEAALDALGASPEETTMVGDDITADIGGAKAAGLRAVLVRTGKFREDTLAAATTPPDAVLDSFAALPDWLAADGQAG
jgi:HAD superfamily hydrolase (TIGR01458 family)